MVAFSLAFTVTRGAVGAAATAEGSVEASGVWVDAMDQTTVTLMMMTRAKTPMINFSP
jgi:hypothetical protein